ncbi:hypothetical protein ACOME3_001893 [Neoechinorhynchus agilis]
MSSIPLNSFLQNGDVTANKSEDILSFEDSSSYLILVRHAQSEYNESNRWTGWHDPPLTETGRLMSYSAGKAFAKLGLRRADSIYTSQLKRTIQTSHWFCSALDLLWLPTFSCSQFNERALGSLQGTFYEEMDDEALPKERLNDDPNKNLYPGFVDLNSPNGLSESNDEFEKRVAYGLSEFVIPDLVQGRNVILFGHSCTIRSICRLFCVDQEGLKKIGNCDFILLWFRKGSMRPGKVLIAMVGEE